MIDNPYNPTWKEHEKGLHSEDPKVQKKAEEAFDETRKKELATSTKAKHWEADRKKQWAKDKPAFVKKRLASELDSVEEFKKELRKGGKFDNTLQPTPGYYVVIVDQVPAETTSGIILPDSVDDMQNTGVVVAEGGVQYDGAELYHPIKGGARILFKKGAGMDIELSWGKCRLMGYADILGVLV